MALPGLRGRGRGRVCAVPSNARDVAVELLDDSSFHCYTEWVLSEEIVGGEEDWGCGCS